MKALLIYGGTFDPPHLGHLDVVDGVHAAWPEDVDMALLPAFTPVHKPAASANADQRLAMLQLLCQSRPWLTVDDRELQSQKPCYSLDSLAQIRAEQGSDRPIFFVLGGDSFAQLHHWQGYQQLLDFAHLLWVPRPGHWPVQGPQALWPTSPLSEALLQSQGCLVHLPLMARDYASRRIRGQRPFSFHAVPEIVATYIAQHRIYHD